MRKKMCTVSQVNPRRKAAHVRLERPLHLGHRRHAPNRRHVAFVEVAERRPRPALEIGGNHLAPRGRPSASPAGPRREPGCPSCSRCARSPSTKISGNPRRIQPVIHNHARHGLVQSGAPSILPSGEACTPAAHSVTDGFNPLAAGLHPARAYAGDLRIVYALRRPDASAPLRPWPRDPAGYAASTRGEPSSRTTAAFGGSMCRKSCRM